MAQTPDSEAGAPSPPQRTTPCQKCGAVNWHWQAARRYWLCRPCDATRQRKRSSSSLHGHGGKKKCSTCETWFTKGSRQGCPRCYARARVALGERRVREGFPADYVALLVERLPEADLQALFLRAGYAQRAPMRRIQASTLFPTISPGMDQRLIRDGTDSDAVCLRTLAALPRHEQGAFYDRYRQDPAQALRWAALPAWKRPIMAGDAEDRHLWKLFTILRLKGEWCARFNEKGLAEEGYQLVQLAGMLESVTNPRRLGMLLSLYGGCLRDGVDVGDVMHPPWHAGPPHAR